MILDGFGFEGYSCNNGLEDPLFFWVPLYLTGAPTRSNVDNFHKSVAQFNGSQLGTALQIVLDL